MTPDELREARGRLEYTQHYLAAVVGVDARAVRRWEARDRTIPTSVAVLIAMIEALPAARSLAEKLADERHRAKEMEQGG